MDNTTLLIIILLVLVLFGGGWYGASALAWTPSLLSQHLLT